MVSSVDMAAKQLINTFYYSDVNTNRNASENIVKDGRTYIKTGTRAATDLVGNLYEIESNVKPVKYLLTVGVARQSEKALNGVNSEDGFELAETQAFINPQIVMEFDHIIDQNIFESFADFYVTCCLTNKFILTPEELERTKLNYA